jgi:small subunit ribosomal protein S6
MIGFYILLAIWAIKPKGNNMNCYETLFVIKPTLTEEEIATQVTKVKDILAKEGAQLVGANDMGMRKLAYPVQKHDRGYYTVLFYKAEGTIINELERNLKISEDVIKFLSVKYSNTKEMTQFNKLVDAASKSETKKVEETKAEPVETETAKTETVEAAKPATTETTEVAEPAKTEATEATDTAKAESTEATEA